MHTHSQKMCHVYVHFRIILNHETDRNSSVEFLHHPVSIFDSFEELDIAIPFTNHDLTQCIRSLETMQSTVASKIKFAK